MLDVQEKFHDSPLFIITGPSEPLALISTITSGGGGVDGAIIFIVTESLTLEAPSVQSMVNVSEPPTAGYQGWLGLMGPSLPDVVTPETPLGVVI